MSTNTDTEMPSINEEENDRLFQRAVTLMLSKYVTAVEQGHSYVVAMYPEDYWKGTLPVGEMWYNPDKAPYEQIILGFRLCTLSELWDPESDIWTGLWEASSKTDRGNIIWLRRSSNVAFSSVEKGKRTLITNVPLPARYGPDAHIKGVSNRKKGFKLISRSSAFCGVRPEFPSRCLQAEPVKESDWLDPNGFCAPLAPSQSTKDINNE